MLLNEPLWYKDAVFYELHVRAYGDENGDGYGDFVGLTRKLDFLQDLGVTAIWLLPFYPSPLRDDGYDIANYTDIHPQYGKLDDFREFLTQAHDRGLRVITELVVNHTSEQHPWFQRARRAPPGSSERDFYVWSETPDRFRDARVIFKDFETSNWTYDPIARAYYWHRFYSHQPDLNFDNPAVWKALLPVVDFWFGMGVDGMRLDAVPYLFEREGTNCENLPETHEYLKALRRHIDERFPNRLLLAEANQWPEDAVAYFGDGDECHMAFHFPVMPRLFMAMHMEDRFPVVDILNQTPTIPENCQWAMFLRNHDELTLEMVTDEERDYMYRAYAHDRQARVNLGIRRRLAPLLGNNRRRIELMNGLLFSLPGTPVIYYGDEIGMGDNIYLGDRNGVRTPMQWSADRNAGFSRANPQRLYLPINIDPEYHYEAVNVEAQQNNPSSLLWWMKRLIGQRRLHKALGRGTIEFLHPQNRRILAFIRQFDDQHILVVANLSRFVQHVELDLSKYSGVVPCELFGGTPFPRIGTLPYLLTFGPHSFYWIQLQPHVNGESAAVPTTPARPVAEIREDDSWQRLFTQAKTRRLEGALRQYLEQIATQQRRRLPRTVRLREFFRIPYAETAACLAIVDVEYAEWTPETLAIPIAFAPAAEVALWTPGAEPAVIARIEGPDSGVLLSAYGVPAFREALLRGITRRTSLAGSDGGELHVWRGARFDALCEPEADAPSSSLAAAPQQNTSIQYGNRLVLKVYRRIEDGTHPESEIGRFLTDVRPFDGVAPLAATVEYRSRRTEPMTLAVLHGFVPNEGDAWQYTLDLLSVFFEQVATIAPLPADRPAPLRLKLSEHDAPAPHLATELLHGFLDMIRLLGKRLAELHRALAGSVVSPEFAPDSFSLQYQRSIYQSMRNLLFDVLYELERSRGALPPDTAARAGEIPLYQGNILRELHLIVNSRIGAARIHCHGDCELHQILFTGKDFVFIDFEGRPPQSVGERWNKSSPLRDMVALLRSFDYAAHGALFGLASGRGRATGVVRPEDRQTLVPWLRIWRTWVHDALLQGYLETCAGDALLPADVEERNLLFRVFLLDQLLSEIDAELTSRPNWLDVPLTGLLEAIKSETGS